MPLAFTWRAWDYGAMEGTDLEAGAAITLGERWRNDRLHARLTLVLSH